MKSVFPCRDTFKNKAKLGNLVPVWCEIDTHHKTPVTAYESVRSYLRNKNNVSHSYLLESAEGGEHIGRYSYIGGSPRAILRGYGNTIEIERGDNKEIIKCTNLLDALKQEMNKYTPVKDENLESRFIGGAVGFFGYDVVSQFEPRIPIMENDDLMSPDMVYMITDGLIIFDNIKNKLVLLTHAHIEDNTDLAYDKALEYLIDLENALNSSFNSLIIESPPDLKILDASSNTTKEEYFEMVEKAKEYIQSGDIIQVVLSQRFEVNNQADSLDIYKSLRLINPSPYMFCLDMGDSSIIGTSPEIHVRCQNQQVEVRPIAGTRPRGNTKHQDEELEKELLNDPKECAEHIMLVDLGRNDIGRVCDFSSIQIPDFMIVERYSHVMHIVSNVVGTLNKDNDIYDVMSVTFPAGTVSGAPKIRAMEIIAELEKSKRGPYAGAVGYFGFDGNFDSAITIRTVILDKDKAYIQAGAGIVADSIAENEYNETKNKALGMIKALSLAKYYNELKGDG